jgi:hypothetical protein
MAYFCEFTPREVPEEGHLPDAIREHSTRQASTLEKINGLITIKKENPDLETTDSGKIGWDEEADNWILISEKATAVNKLSEIKNMDRLTFGSSEIPQG